MIQNLLSPPLDTNVVFQVQDFKSIQEIDTDFADLSLFETLCCNATNMPHILSLLQKILTTQPENYIPSYIPKWKSELLHLNEAKSSRPSH